MPDTKRIRFRVIPQEEGMTLRNLLTRRLPHTDRARAADLIKAGGVYVNRLRLRVPSVRVVPGERVTVHTDALDVTPVDPASLVFVHRDPSSVILDKPAGIPAKPTRASSRGTLSEALIRRLESEGRPRPYVGLVHALPSVASGLCMFSIRSVEESSRHQQLRELEIVRGFVIRTRGPLPEPLSCNAPIVEPRDGRVRLATAEDSDKAQPATTDFEVLPNHLLRAELDAKTPAGQLLVHIEALGLELLELHAHDLEFNHPDSGEPLLLEAPTPR